MASFDDRADPIRVLHVDDEPSITDVVSTFLEHESDRLSVTTANSVEAACEYVDAVDCIVSDYQMPGTDGLEFLELVRADHPDLPFVLFTGEGSESVAEEAISAGVTDYIQKGGTEKYVLLANRIENAVEQYRATRRLRRQTDLFEKTQRLANVGGWELDLETDELRWTDGVRRIFGVDLDYEPTVEAALEFYHPEDAGTVERALERAIEEGEPYDVEARAHTAAGRQRWLRTRGEPQRADGRTVRLRGTVQDVTERKNRERKLRAYNSTIESLHRAATDIAAAESETAIAERTVQAAEELLDFRLCSVLYYEDGWLEPIAFSQETPPDGADSVPVDEPDTGGLAGKTYRTGESYVVDHVEPGDDTDPAKESYRSGISVPIGKHAVFQAVATDPEAFDDRDLELAELLVAHTTSALDRLASQEELRDQNERLEEFSRVVSHDLKNPIEVARSGVELARATGDLDRLEDTEHAIDRMEHIVDDLLTIAFEGSGAVDVQPVEFEAVVREAWTTVDAGDAILDVEAGLRILADPGLLGRLAENLVRNAVEHGSTSPPSQIREDAVEHGSTSPPSQTREDAVEHGPDGVSDTPDGDGPMRTTERLSVRVGSLDDGFYVEDDGGGISEDIRGAVTEQGFSTVEGGTGLGLAIVERIAGAHGWDLTVTESGDGGARFEFTGVEFED